MTYASLLNLSPISCMMSGYLIAADLRTPRRIRTVFKLSIDQSFPNENLKCLANYLLSHCKSTRKQAYTTGLN